MLFELLDENHKDIKKNHMDCGMQIFDEESQDTHAGGSGCACSALMLSAVILPKLASGEWKRVLFYDRGIIIASVNKSGKNDSGNCTCSLVRI